MNRFIIALSFALSACSTMQKDNLKNKGSKNENVPELTKPVVRQIWIPDQIIDGGKIYDQGHWRYVLDRDTTWSK